MNARGLMRPFTPGLARIGFAVLAGLFLTIASAHAERRVALVVGNSSYLNVPRLGNPNNDARLMADTLRSLGFTLVGGGAQLDLNEDGFRRAVAEFGKQLQGADVGLFYYAGHGVQVRGENYLVPVDANPTREADVDFQMVDTNLVLRQMEDTGTKLNLVILDACRNNPFGGRNIRSTTGGLAEMHAPEGTLISFATQPGNVAIDGSNGHSPFTQALAVTMRRPGLGLFDAFNEVGITVQRATGSAQQPWFASSPINGSFYFSSGPAGGTKSAKLEIEPMHEMARGKLPDVLQYDMLNAQVDYLEHLIGPALHVNMDAHGGQLREYRVDGCQLEALVGKNPQGNSTAIIAYTLTLAPKCNFNFKSFGFANLSTRGLTVTKIPDSAFLGFESDCIYLCGNAVDPTVDFIHYSSHATNWIGIVFTVVLADDPALTAIDKFRELLEAKEGHGYVADAKFNCDQRYADAATRLFANVPINKITIGIFPDDPGRRCH